MNSHIKIKRIPYEEPYHLRLIFDISNREISAKVEIYCTTEDLLKTGNSIIDFSGSKEDQYQWEMGSENRDERFAYYFLLKISAIDDYGHYCIHFKFNKNEDEPTDGKVEFSMVTELEGVIKLGNQLKGFSKLETFELDWIGYN